jgi:hypothetical protein
LAAGNLWETARTLVRQELPELTAQRPSVSVKSGWWRRWRWQRQVDRLWRIASGSVPVVVSPKAFTRLLAEVKGLKSAVARGAVHFQFSS